VSGLRRELVRKAFHMLSLAYWGVFLLLGWPLAAKVMGAWLAVVFLVETARLRVPAAQRALAGAFSGIIRDSERRRYSGILFTSAGCLLAMLIARGDGRIVAVAILQLTFTDSAAALAGKAFGRTKVLGGEKSLEGALAGLSAGYTVALLCGVGPGPALASALATSLTELLPTAGLLNDNLWMPAASAATLAVLLGR